MKSEIPLKVVSNSGISTVPFRIAIMEKNGESWLFDQVNRKESKAFVEAYKATVG